MYSCAAVLHFVFFPTLCITATWGTVLPCLEKNFRGENGNFAEMEHNVTR